MYLDTLVVGDLATNCYVVGCERTRTCGVIDPGGDAEIILAKVAERDLALQWVLLTHSHFDHVLAIPEIVRETEARVAIHEADAESLYHPPEWCRAFVHDLPEGVSADRTLSDGDHVSIGDLDLEVIHTPGHTPGGISLRIEAEDILFSGDALFREGLGRSDLPGGNARLLQDSITRRLLTMPDRTTVYPGHGPITTIGHESRNNPWLKTSTS